MPNVSDGTYSSISAIRFTIHFDIYNSPFTFPSARANLLSFVSLSN